MKKLLTLALAAVTAVSAFGQKVDIFSGQGGEGVQVQGAYMKNLDPTTYTGNATGITYNFLGTGHKGYPENNAFTIAYGAKGVLVNSDNADGYTISEISNVKDWAAFSTPFDIYLSNEPLTLDNYQAKGTKYGDGLEPDGTVTITGSYKYFALVGNLNYFMKTLKITWTGGEVTNPKADKPGITEPAVKKVGEKFTFTSDQDVTFSYKYLISDNEVTGDIAYDQEETGASLTIPANAAGKWLYFSVTAKGENLEESEPATWGGQIEAIQKPVAAVPEIQGGAPATAKVGDKITFTTATEGGRIEVLYIYSDNANLSESGIYVNGQELKGASPLELPVTEGNEGKYLHIDAITTADGYTSSSSMTASVKIDEAQTPGPGVFEDVTDNINSDNIYAQNPTAALSTWYSGGTNIPTLTYTGASNVEYEFTDLYLCQNGQNGTGKWWAINWQSGKSGLRNTTAPEGAHIKSIKLKVKTGDPASTYIRMANNADMSGDSYEYPTNESGVYTWNVDSYKYKYFIFNNFTGEMIDDLAIEWTADPAELDPAAKPVITAPAEVKVGEEFTFSTTSEGATTWYQVAVEDAETDTPNYAAEVEGASYTVKEEEAGKVLYFSVVAKGDNYKDSEATVDHFNVAKAEEPEFVDVTDHITNVSLKAQNADGKFNANGTTSHASSNAKLVHNSSSNDIAYELTYVLANSDTDPGWGWWCLDWYDAANPSAPSPAEEFKGVLVNTKAPSNGHIKNLTIKLMMGDSSLASQYVYFANEPLTLENYRDKGTQVGLAGGTQTYTVTPSEEYKYMYFNLAQTYITDLAIEWTADAPAIPVAGINFDNLKNHSENSDKDFSSEWNEGGTRNVNDMLIHEQDGIRYELHNVVAGASATEGVSGWWSLENGGYLRTAENADNTNRIVSIEYTGVGTSGIADLNVYVSNEQLTPENVADKGVKVSFAVAESGPAAAPAAQADNTLGNPVKWDAGNADYKHLYIVENGRDVAVRNLNVAWGIPTGIEAIDAENANAEVYNLNGYRVNPENLAPGVYVRKVNGKTSKFIVK